MKSSTTITEDQLLAMSQNLIDQAKVLRSQRINGEKESKHGLSRSKKIEIIAKRMKTALRK